MERTWKTTSSSGCHDDDRVMCDKVKVKAAQLCPTLCDPIDYTVLGIL